jgi:DNA-binding MarR family transcriptional regulator
MPKINPPLKLFISLAKIQAIMSRRFDSHLGGLGFNEFIILYHLSLVRDEKMRRIDLADKVGLTASGITRLLLPMEKIGLIKKESNEQDARVSLVSLAPGGKRKLSEAMERAEIFTEEIIPEDEFKKAENVLKFFTELIGKINL